MSISAIFPNMADVVPEGTIGLAKITHFEVTEDAAKFTSLRAIVTGSRDAYVRPGRYAQLVVGNTLMMSDTSMERNSNYEVVRKAHGRVLIAGLGLGMILHPIAAKPEVTEVVVIEKYADVAVLVQPTLPAKVKVIVADIFDWKPAKGEKFNTVYFDIWPNISEDNLEDMAKLHRRFSHYLDRSAYSEWMDSWKRGELKSRRARNKRSGNRWW